MYLTEVRTLPTFGEKKLDHTRQPTKTQEDIYIYSAMSIVTILIIILVA